MDLEVRREHVTIEERSNQTTEREEIILFVTLHGCWSFVGDANTARSSCELLSDLFVVIKGSDQVALLLLYAIEGLIDFVLLPLRCDDVAKNSGQLPLVSLSGSR